MGLRFPYFKIIVTSDLARSLRQRYYQLGNFDDIERDILLCEEIIAAYPCSSLDHARLLTTLGLCYTVRSSWFGAADDIDRSIDSRV